MKPQTTQAPPATAPATPVRTVQHATPGPWHVDWHTSASQIGVFATLPNEGEVIRIAALDRLDGADLPNARLIAAAPDLLASCKSVLHELPDLASSGQYKTDACIATLRAAIERAEGGRQ